MHDPHFFRGQNLDIFRRNPDAVSCQRAAFEHTQFIQHGDRRFAIFFHTLIDFPLGLGQMHMDFRSQSLGHGNNFFHALRRASIRSVRAKHDRNPAIRRPVIINEQLFVFFKPLILLRTVSLNQAARQRGAHAGFLTGFGNLIHKEIHVGKRRGAGCQHFGNRQLSAPVYVFRDQFGFGRPNFLLQPVEQRHVVRITAEQRHRRMRVRIDKSRCRKAVAAINDFIRLPARRARPAKQDFAVFNADIAANGFTGRIQVFAGFKQQFFHAHPPLFTGSVMLQIKPAH